MNTINIVQIKQSKNKNMLRSNKEILLLKIINETKFQLWGTI